MMLLHTALLHGSIGMNCTAETTTHEDAVKLLSTRHAKRSSIPGRRDNSTLAPKRCRTNLELEHLFHKAISVYELGNIAIERLASRLVILSVTSTPSWKMKVVLFVFSNQS
jgi:hypothetical protein